MTRDTFRRNLSAISRPDKHDNPFDEPKDGSSDSANDTEIRRLARVYSQASTLDGADNPFEAPAGSSLDPGSDNFKAKAWTKAMLKLHAADETRFKPRSAGISFRDLSAYGYSAATDYQKTVGNYALDLIGLARRAVGQKPRRLDILRSLDGLVRAGEMLVVLGPPGSGCSTFLKTIAGETHGFEVAKSSHINYQGTTAQPFLKIQKLKGTYRNQLQADAFALPWRGDLHSRAGCTLSVADRWRHPPFRSPCSLSSISTPGRLACRLRKAST